VDRNQDLLGKIKRLEQREEEAAKTLSEQLGESRALRRNLDDLTKKGAERDVKLNTGNQVNRNTHTHTHTHTHSSISFSGIPVF